MELVLSAKKSAHRIGSDALSLVQVVQVRHCFQAEGVAALLTPSMFAAMFMHHRSHCG